MGALLDLGGNEARMRASLASLPFGGYRLEVAKMCKWGLAGTSFDVHLEDHHHHGDGVAAHGHHHEHRNLADVMNVIGAGQLTSRARALAEAAFRIVAQAEAQAHGVSIDEVHFHEVGAVDSICDIVAAAVLADDLDVTECVVTALAEGAGLIECAHGALPVPVPAVTNIAIKHGIVLKTGTADTELVTPTGIALAAALRTRDRLPQAFKVLKCGIGFGTREIGRANCLRAMFIEDAQAEAGEDVWVLEANVDDATGEQLAMAQEAIFAAGARDCHFSPCCMKKSRPGWLIRVITDQPLVSVMEKILFRETTTIGVRRYPVKRTVMARESVRVAVKGGEVEAKRCEFEGLVRCYPEADSVKALAEKTGRAFQDIYHEAINSPTILYT